MAANENVTHLQKRMDRARGGSDSEPPTSRPIVLRHIAEIVAEERETEWLIHNVIERNVLAVIAGPRGTFKSFIALDWAMRMAVEGHAGILLSAEGGGLDRRVAAWIHTHDKGLDLIDLPITAYERRLNLNSVVVLDELRTVIAQQPTRPAFIVIDTFSKFSAGLDENDNGKVAGFLDGLSEILRDEFNCTVLLVAHSGHGDAKRPRGAYSLMANPDCEYIVDRPAGGMTVTVSRERFKDSPSQPPLAYEAKVVDLGRLDAYGERVTSLALVSADAPTPARRTGKNQERALVALNEWARVNPEARLITSIDITEIFKAQNIYPKRRKEVLEYLTNIRVLTPALGGFTVDQAML